VRINLAVLFLVLFFSASNTAFPQSPNGSISGVVLDQDAKSIPGAELIVLNDVTGERHVTSTNNEGIYAVSDLPPGPYRIQVAKVGFKSIIKPDIVLNVQDALSINFTLPIGATSVVVTVEGGAPVINTTDGSVSTVIDHKFIENVPLNGRSFQDLILLTPGVVTNSPQTPSAIGVSGEFSVNGQRTEANYYTVDGVSANVGLAAGFVETPGTSGSISSATALGTTHSLVSVDALEEFRVHSSTYSAEYGRSPGGQFSFVTRSGTNQWHGTAFDYLRNNFFDANDWFNDFFQVRQPALRQNDFGGTLGGPIKIPGLYDGKDKSFFFFSYEGLRLRQPQEATISHVPTAALRSTAPSALQAVLNSFPLPNCAGSSAATSCTNDLGNGLGDFVGSWSNPSSLDAYSFRVDHNLNSKLRLFFRFSDTPSEVSSRFSGVLFGVPSTTDTTTFETRTFTAGATSVLSKRLNNDFRLNFSTNESTIDLLPDNFGGATRVNLLQAQNLDLSLFPNASLSICLAPLGYFSCIYQQSRLGKQKQWNVVDTLNISRGRHELRFGVDYRRLAARQYTNNPTVDYVYDSPQAVQNNSVDFGFAESFAAAFPVYTNFSAFGQDEWRLSPRLSLSMGLRWDVNPAPGVSQGNQPYTIKGNITDPASLQLAAKGTPLWQTSWANVSPRLSAAYILRTTSGFETVVRGGFGVFFDTGQQEGSQGFQGPGFQALKFFGGIFGKPSSFPLSVPQITPPIINPPAVPYGTFYAFPSHLSLPFTLQWNVSAAQALGRSQSLTVSYVGANGRRLLRLQPIAAGSLNPAFTVIEFYGNGLTSDYGALQVQFQRRFTQGLQLLASYNWAHSIDYGSYNAALPYKRASSDFDVRNSFSSALSYDIPRVVRGHLDALLGSWGVDGRITARSGFPVTLNGDLVEDPATAQFSYAGLNLVPGKTIYIYGSQYPGGRSINPDAFVLPAPGTVGNAPRNLARGFGAWQMDLAVHRTFALHEGLKLQFRAESFNILNHPNFGLVNPNYCAPGPGCTFGQATATLAQSLGVLSSVYQTGGPRSMQLSLKLLF
jgi:hypothetical protein